MADTTKTVLGNYELQRVLGDGAEGRVYQAVCAVKTISGVALGEAVAIKRLFKKPGQDKEPQQFRRQIEILSKLNHRNIVRYKDSFVWRETELEADLHCLVMELLDGESFKTLLEKNPRGLAWEKARGVLLPVLEALQYASENGVIHRDLKPSNIHITSAAVPKLMDFGIARQDDGEADATASTAGAKGTFDYMAPDFAKDGKFRGDEQSDIFSFGIILHYTLTGGLPFPALGDDANRGYFIRWIGSAAAPAPDFRHPIFRVLNQAGACVAKCINPDRAARFKSFSEVAANFQEINFRKLKHGADTYDFLEWLGKGGFGEVFKAKRVRDGRLVAIKRLFGAEQSARFVREAKILREAAHPNLTEYVDFVEAKVREDEREFYLVLEFLEGMPGAGLRERIKATVSGLEPIETLQLFARYLDCLDHLHRNGIIHRDLKPGNLYAPAGQSQRAKIFDLGIARDDEGTKTRGQVPGTLDYMPPEFASQSSGRGSAQSDLYSLGVTLYQTLTRKLPFPRLPKSESEAWVEFFRRSEKPLPCSFEHPVFQARPELVPLLQRCLAPTAAERFDSAAAMRDEINGGLLKWELATAGRNPDQATEVTLFVKSTILPSLETELAPVAAEIQAAPSATEIVEPAVVEPDPVELENQRLAAEEAAQKNLKTELEHTQKLAEQVEQRASETAARRRVMEAKWQEDEVKRKAEELAAQELQRQAEAEESKKKQVSRQQRNQDIADIKAQLWQQAARIGRACGQFFQAAKARGQKVFTQATRKWRDLGGLRGLVEKPRQLGGKIVGWVGRAWQFVLQKISAARSSRPAKSFAEKVRRSKIKSVAGWLAFRSAVKNSVVQSVQKWRGIRKNIRSAIVVSAAGLVVVLGYFSFNQTRSHLRAKAYEQAVAQAHDDFNRADFAGAAAAAEKALAIRGDDPALQKLASDSQQRHQLQTSLAALLQNGQTALAHQDYSNALLWAEAVLGKFSGNSNALALQENARLRLTNFLAATMSAQVAFTSGDFASAETNADRALDLSAKDTVMQQLKAEAHAKRLNIAAYQAAMVQAQAAFKSGDFTNAALLAATAAQKIPGDVEADQLRGRAEKNLNDYHQAVNAAHAAVAGLNFLAAQENADLALSIYPYDPAMQQLRTNAATRFDGQKIYVEALKSAQAALNRQDYSNAVRFANSALDKVPGERTAITVRESAQDILNGYHTSVNAATTAFKNGDFFAAATNADNALAVYGNDPAMRKFKANALDKLGSLKSYQLELANAQATLTREDFAGAVTAASSALKKMPGDSAATKIKEAAQQSLKQLTETVSQAQSAYVLENYANALTLADKALTLQKQNPAIGQLKSKIVRRLDGRLIELLASFGASIPPELKYAEINPTAKLGPVGAAGKPYYQAQADQLEKLYRVGNWLDENNRQSSLQTLRQAIDSWE